MKTAIIREATAADVPALACLHVTTFNETQAPELMNGPTYEVREYQWRQAFQSGDESWFCYVIEDPNGELIGFAEGQPYAQTRPTRLLPGEAPTRFTYSVSTSGGVWGAPPRSRRPPLPRPRHLIDVAVRGCSKPVQPVL